MKRAGTGGDCTGADGGTLDELGRLAPVVAVVLATVGRRCLCGRHRVVSSHELDFQATISVYTVTPPRDGLLAVRVRPPPPSYDVRFHDPCRRDAGLPRCDRTDR